MAIGLFVGRFQPFHYGHLTAVVFALKRVDFLYIAVGSAQKSHTEDNPFTAAERIRMIKSTLDAEGIRCQRWLLIPVPDARAHSVWLASVNALVPPFDVVFSNDPLTLRLFRESGRKAIQVPYLKREIYSATRIRNEMLRGKSWKTKLPPSVAKIIVEIKGVERLRQINR